MKTRKVVAVVAATTLAATVGVLVRPRSSLPLQYRPSQAYEIAETQDIKYRLADRAPRNLTPTLDNTRIWMDHHRGPYRLRVWVKNEGSGEWGPWRTEQETISQMRDRLTALGVGRELQVQAESDKVRLFILKVDLNPAKIIDTVGTHAVDIIVGSTVTRFPNVQNWGIYACKRVSGSYNWSQHAWGNAVDWGGSHELLHAVAAWQKEMINKGYLPISQLIWQVPNHYNHIHDSGDPLKTGTPPCG